VSNAVMLLFAQETNLRVCVLVIMMQIINLLGTLYTAKPRRKSFWLCSPFFLVHRLSILKKTSVMLGVAYDGYCFATWLWCQRPLPGVAWLITSWRYGNYYYYYYL